MFAEFDKVVRCLALELPEPVHADVVAKYGKLKAEVEKFTSTNTGSPKCEQCEHYDISQGVYTVECYSCKRYCGDLFTLRAGA